MSLDDAGEGAQEPGIDGEQGRSEPPPSPEVVDRLVEASANAAHLDAYLDPDALVIKDLYTWEHFKRRYYYEEDWPSSKGSVVPGTKANRNPTTITNVLIAIRKSIVV